MSTRYEEWMRQYTAHQMRLDSGHLADAHTSVDLLRASASAVAIEGLDLAEVCRVIGVLAEVDLSTKERRFREAERLLEDALLRVPVDVRRSAFVRANRLVAEGNLALSQDAIESAAALYRDAATAAPEDQLLIRANALFNLGSCLIALGPEKDDPKFSEAIEAYNAAGELYAELSLLSKYADCFHVVGNAHLLRGDYETAITYHGAALDRYRKQSNQRGIWMTADDASRAMLLRASELEGAVREEWLEMALNASIGATVASNHVWASAAGNDELQSQLSVDLENHLVNRIEIALAKAPMLVHTALAQHKSRIRASHQESVDLLTALVDEPRHQDAIREGIAPALHGAIVSGVRLLLRGDERVAVVDQFVIRGRELVSAIYIISRTEERMQLVRSVLDDCVPDRADEDEPRFRGGGRASPAAPVIERLMQTIQRGGGRAMTLLGSRPLPESSEERDQILEWAADTRSDAALLGDWFFPPVLLSYLKEQEVDHVILVPDPHYVQVPYLLLESDDCALIDQPWTFSTAPAVLDVVMAAARYRSQSLDLKTGLVWFAPDLDVNEHRGGNEELEALGALFSTRAIVGSDATTVAALGAIADGAWLHFRGHGNWDASDSARGPICSDGVLTTSIMRATQGQNTAHGAVLVTVACGTGFAAPVGTETFGSLAEYAPTGLRAAILTLWPIAGDSATPFMTTMYRELANGTPLAQAFDTAVRETRERLPHPFFWSCFSLVGSWSLGLSASSIRPTTTEQPSPSSHHRPGHSRPAITGQDAHDHPSPTTQLSELAQPDRTLH